MGVKKNRRPQASGFRLQTSGFRLQEQHKRQTSGIGGFRLFLLLLLLKPEV